MADLLAPYHGLTCHPVELNHASWTGEQLVAMPRIITTTECQQRPFDWRDLENHVIQIVSRAEQSKPATGRFPTCIHVDQDRDDFCLRVSVDFPVLFAATAAHGDHIWSVR